jgi:hypothetical protein
MQYVDYAYYRDTYKGTLLTENDADKFLRKASYDVNNLSFGRIESVKFDHLSDCRKESIREVVCRQADFLSENSDILQTYLNQYAINGVSMTFGSSWNLHVEQGTAIPADVYQILVRAGLTCRSIDGYGC